MKSKLIGKRCYITDRESQYYDEWGIIQDYDGEYYFIMIANGSGSIPIFKRNEFHIYRVASTGV